LHNIPQCRHTIIYFTHWRTLGLVQMFCPY
jgi:hypothetical protein